MTPRGGCNYGGLGQTELTRKAKARAEVELRREEILNSNAARKIQVWWSRVTGTYAAKLKARAEVELRREEIRMNAAALKIQSRWRIKQGKMTLHLKRQAKADKIASVVRGQELPFCYNFGSGPPGLAWRSSSTARP